MATCPSGHDSASDDFCDVCGIRIGAATECPPSPAVALPDGGATATMPAPAEACPQCGAARTGQFCESCGHDFTKATSGSLAPPPAATPPARATSKLGRAVALAHQAGNEDTARLLAKVVDVVDEATGTVRLKKKVEAADEMALDTRSTKTVRVKKG